jgi:hypothetical protein
MRIDGAGANNGTNKICVWFAAEPIKYSIIGGQAILYI